MKLLKSVGKSLFAATVLGITLSLTPTDAWAGTTAMQQQQQYGTVKGVVTADNGHYVSDHFPIYADITIK